MLGARQLAHFPGNISRKKIIFEYAKKSLISKVSEYILGALITVKHTQQLFAMLKEINIQPRCF